MNTSLKFASRSFPSRVADLGFSAELPADWISHELPAETPDFSDPTAFFPLAVVTAPHAALVFAFGARPAYDDGTLHDWVWYLIKHNELTPITVGRGTVAGVPAAIVEGTKDSEMGIMVVRFAIFEDGGRLVNATFTAPALLEGAVREAWFAMLRSFRLESPRGSRFPLEAAPDETPSAPIDPEVPPAVADALPAETHAEDPDMRGDDATTSPRGQDIAMRVPVGLARRKCRFSDFAQAADSASLDPENPINASLRDRGAGLVPNVVETSVEARRSRVAAGALEAFVDVPFGWHVIDDGQRTLVFEPGGKVQINLDLIPRDDRDADTILDAIESDARDAYPIPQFNRRTDGALRTLSICNIADGDQPLEQHHLLRAGRDDTRVVRARVTATPEESADAWILGTLVLESCVFPHVQEDTHVSAESDEDASCSETTSAAQPPVWWQRAIELEALGQLKAAEEAIRDGCQHIGFAASTAEMYRLRMNRLKAAGDRAGALDAFKRSSEFISFYASMATSGGEGAALSCERDQFRAQLVAEFGSDPEARRA